jgi:putative membrane-bound dehydrogenase-like protein
MKLHPLVSALAFLPSLPITPCRSADFPEPANSEKVAGAPMPAADAAAAVQLPEGFSMNVFAAEPAVRNPIAMAWDGRGRMWIAENFTYAERPIKMDTRYRDRIIVLEDSDHDGDADKGTTFADDLQGLMSVEVGAGGIWAIALPRLLFIPDKNGDDVPDGPAQTVLDGFPMPDENHHNCANGLRWGPDGWLYGRCGASGPAMAGAPGTPAAERVPVNGGVWRYHPGTKAFETLCSGTTNPWGMDWNAEGELFFSNTVNGHLWHVIPGAHYARPHTLDPNPLTYFLIDQHADHYHFDTGKGWGNSRDGKANSFGGGHAHCGLMVYQGANWPAEYRNKIYMLNFHGRRINCDLPERKGSGYVAKHGTDMALMADPFFRGIDLTSGPDGAVYVLDWSDTGECHEGTGVHRSSGRIYRISHRDAKPATHRDWRTASEVQLARHLLETDQWHVRAGRQELIRRTAGGEYFDAIRSNIGLALYAWESDLPDPARLEGLWTLHVTGGVDEPTLLKLLGDPAEAIRTWAVRLLVDAQLLDTPLSRIRAGALDESRFAALKKCAAEDKSGLVRLTLTSSLQRLPAEQRLELAKVLAARSEDAIDPNLPAMLWYALIPLAQSHPQELAAFAAAARQPLTRQCIARCLTAQIDKHPAAVEAMLKAAIGEIAALSDVTEGMALALKGRRKAPAPASWPAVVAAATAPPELAARVRELSVVFGSGRALEEIRALALNRSADLRDRKAALASLIEARPDDLREVCESALKERFLNAVAVQGLTSFDDPQLGKRIAGSYGSFHPFDRPALISVLASRPAFSAALLDAIAAGAIPRSDLSAFKARQIIAFNEESLTARLKTVWGSIREGSGERRAFITKLKSSLTPAALSQADLKAGRQLYTSLCSSCHTLYGEGGKLGPDLTGAQRHDLDYLLENIIDPGAVVTADFKMSLVRMKDGSLFSGVITTKSEKSLTLHEPLGPRTLDAAGIAAVESSADSIMPAGVLEVLPEDQVRSLIAYLMQPSQVPLK